MPPTLLYPKNQGVTTSGKGTDHAHQSDQEQSSQEPMKPRTAGGFIY